LSGVENYINLGFGGLVLFLVMKKLDDIVKELREIRTTIVDKIHPDLHIEAVTQ
jgi:hypothetical protein